MDSFNLEILSPERPFYKGECVSLIVPISDGMMGVMANHEPMTAAILDGELTFTLPDGTTKICVVSRGILNIDKKNTRILCDSALAPEEVDEVLERQLQIDNEIEEKERVGMLDYRRTQLAFAKAVNALKNRQDKKMKN